MKKVKKSESKVYQIIDSEIKENFNFLFVGHWLSGNFGEDRKDIGMLIKVFLETFRNKKSQPGLILKTQSATPCVMDREEILSKINKIRDIVSGDLPNIYLLHGEFTDEEMNELYNHPKIAAHVSFTKGEGFGRPLLEASLSQKPIITSRFSGPLDFLNPEMSVLLPGEIKKIHPSAVVEGLLIPESSWFTVSYKDASKVLEDVYVNYKKYIDGGKRQAYYSRTNFSLDKMGEKLLSILDEKTKDQVSVVPLKLPNFSKVELPKLEKIN